MNYGYLLFMGLLCTTLVLWGIVALREDGPAEDDSDDAGDEAEATRDGMHEQAPPAAEAANRGQEED